MGQGGSGAGGSSAGGAPVKPVLDAGHVVLRRLNRAEYNNTVRDVVFEDIRVERIEEGKLFSLKIAYTEKYNTSPGLAVENITLRNVHYSGKGSPSASLIAGRDAQRKVRNVILDNVTVGGKKLTRPEAGTLDINEFVEGVQFR